MTYLVTEPGEAALLGGRVQRALAQVTEEVLLEATVGGGQAAAGHGHQLPVLLVDHTVRVCRIERSQLQAKAHQTCVVGGFCLTFVCFILILLFAEVWG